MLKPFFTYVGFFNLVVAFHLYILTCKLVLFYVRTLNIREYTIDLAICE